MRMSGYGIARLNGDRPHDRKHSALVRHADRHSVGSAGRKASTRYHGVTTRWRKTTKPLAVPNSFVAGPPKNGVHFMVKDSRKYASTGGWGFAQFNDGKPADEAVHKTCFTCHQAVQARDLVSPVTHLERLLMKFRTKNKEKEQ
jgi:hypothetical protein